MKKEIKPTPVLKTVQSFWTKLDMRKRVIAGLTAGMMAFGFGYYYTHAKTVADAVRTDMGQHTKVQFVGFNPLKVGAHIPTSQIVVN